MIEISRVCKSFGGVPAVHDVSFTAPDGQVLVFVAMLVGMLVVFFPA